MISDRMVSVRLTPTELLAVEQLVKLGYFRSRSEMIRSAVMNDLLRRGLDVEGEDRIKSERWKRRRRRRERP